MKKIKTIRGKIVTPYKVEEGKVLLMEEEKILDLVPEDGLRETEIIGAEDYYIIPGLIDIHSDALEFKLSPRPGIEIPLDLAFSSYEKELLSCGITTQFHGVYWGDVLEKHRSIGLALDMVRKILDYKPKADLDHKIFIRFDIYKLQELEKLLELIEKNCVDLLSFQYHLPKEAQWKDLKAFKEYYSRVRGWSHEELDNFIENDFSFSLKGRRDVLERISQKAKEYGISLASHDDDSEEKISFMKDLGVKISEFPLSLETSVFAKENGLKIVVGAPNIVRGKSSCGNIRATFLIENNCADIVSSDYHPSSLLYASIKLYKLGILKLHEAINMVTLNPAEAVGLKDRGCLLPSKRADIVIFKLRNRLPVVVKVIVMGRCVYSYEG